MNIARTCQLFLFFGLSGSTLFAQTQTDSLRRVIQNTTDKSQRIQLLLKINESFFAGAKYDSLGKYSDELITLSDEQQDELSKLAGLSFKSQSYLRKDSLMFFTLSQQALQQSEQKQYTNGIAVTCLGMGSRLLTLGKYDLALEYLKKGSTAIKDNDPADLIALKSDLVRTISAVHHHQGNYTAALEDGLESSELAERVNNPIQVLKSYLNLSGLYGELSSPENGLGTADDRQRYHAEAKKYMKLSYKLSVTNASPLTQGATAFNLGSLYSEDKHEDSARYYLNEAIRLGRATSFHELLSNAFRTKSTLYPRQPDSAIFYLDLASLHSDKARNPITKVATALDKAKVWMSQRKWMEAERLTLNTLAEAQQLNLLNDQRAAYLILFEVKSAQHDYKQAIDYYKKYNTVKDSIINEKNFARIEELKTKYETGLKDKEIIRLEQESILHEFEIRQKNYLLIGVLVGAMLIAGFVFLYYRQRTLIQQQKTLAIENKFLRFQLDPHFLSNALVSIQRFMLENNAAEASNYLTKFSRLMRQLLEYSREEFITIEEEIDLLKNYLALQKLRFRDSFDYEIHVDENLSVADSKISPMFAQPFVENAIEHGASKVHQGRVTVTFKEANGRLQLTIEDNGPGMPADREPGKQSASTTIMQERIDLLNRSSQIPFEMKTGRASSGTGVAVELLLPIYS